MLHERLQGLASAATPPGDDRPFLFELRGRAGEAAGRGRLFTWSTGEVMAAIAPDGESVRLREVDETDSELVLTRGDILLLDEVCQDWARRRDGWFEYGSKGHWTESGRFHFLVEPGGTGERVKVSQAWQGTDVRTPLATPELIASGAQWVANLFRVGETVGPVDGAPVGCEYDLAGSLRAIARRTRLDLRRGDAKLSLRAGEEMLPQALLRVFPAAVSNPGATLL